MTCSRSTPIGDRSRRPRHSRKHRRERRSRARVHAEASREAAGFRTRRHAIRVLGPAEILARRSALRAALQAWDEQHLKKSAKKARLAELATLDVIAVSGDDPLILFDTTQRRDNRRCYARVFNADWWEAELGWCLSEVTGRLKDEIEARIGDVFRLRLGKAPGAATQRTRLVKAEKFYEAIVDGTQLLTRSGRLEHAGKVTVKELANAGAAAAQYAKVVAAAKKKGFSP